MYVLFLSQKTSQMKTSWGKCIVKLYLIITLYWRQNSAKCFETAHTYLLA